jgi:type IV pilus assembly protein PilA
MKRADFFHQSKGFSLMELMVVTAIISLLAAIAIPNYIRYRNNSFCSLAETDANNVSRAISDYFSMGAHNNRPDPADLKVTTNNPFSIAGDPNTTIVITVTDQSGRCPAQGPNWDPADHTYTINIQ